MAPSQICNDRWWCTFLCRSCTWLIRSFDYIFPNLLFAFPHADVDECSDPSKNNCNALATCTDTVGSYRCSCKSGYSGNGVSCQGVFHPWHLFNEFIRIWPYDKSVPFFQETVSSLLLGRLNFWLSWGFGTIYVILVPKRSWSVGVPSTPTERD